MVFTEKMNWERWKRGKFADVIVIDKNLFQIDQNEILNCKVVLTIMDGEIVFER